MKLFSVVLLVVFAIIGVISFIRELTYFLFANKDDDTMVLIAPIRGKCENAEFILRSAATKIYRITRGKNKCIICLDCDMDEETKIICKKICEDYGFIKILNKDEFFDFLQNNSAAP